MSGVGVLLVAVYLYGVQKHIRSLNVHVN